MNVCIEILYPLNTSKWCGATFEQERKAVQKELWGELSLQKRNPVAYLGDLPISCTEVA